MSGTAHLARALTHEGPAPASVADPALRAHATEILGHGPLAWAAVVAAESTQVVAERNSDRPVHHAALGSINEEVLLAALLAMAGRPAVAGTYALAQPEIVRYVVEHAIPLHRLVASIRVVQQHWIDRLRARAVELRARPDIVQSAVLIVAETMNRHLDTQIREFVAESERVRHNLDARRGQMVERLVNGHAGDTGVVGDHLGIDPSACYVGLVLTTADRGPSGAESLLAGAAVLVRGIGLREGLRHEPAGGALWIWAVAPDDWDLAPMPGTALDATVRVGMGSAHRGVAGVRRSHIEATDAVRFAGLGGYGQVVRHRTVALASLLAQDPEEAGWFVETHLGRLADADEATGELRDTLACFYRAQMRLVTASAQLGVHRNTMIHRLRRIEGLLGHSVGERVPELLCALLLLETLAQPGLLSLG